MERLLTGRRIGVFEVHGLLGVGGMGEVYRARDPRLARDVAIKVLPDLFANDPERLARFYTEVFDMETRPELILLQKSMVIVEGVARARDQPAHALPPDP